MKPGTIPSEVIEAVLKKTDIVDVVNRYVSLTKRGRNHLGLCPFHSEKSPSFNVSQELQIFRCFGCGATGDVIKFLINIEGITFPEAVRSLAEETGIQHDFSAERAELTPEQREAQTMVAANEEAVKFMHYVLNNTAQGQKAYQYLKERGFTQRLIDEFRLGYAPPNWDVLTKHLLSKQFPLALLEKAGLVVRRTEGDGAFDRFRDRVMFPIEDGQGRTIAFGGRTLGNEQPKYLNSPDSPLFHKNRVLYRLHAAKASIRKLREAVLFEGYADVIKAWEAGVDNGVATLGTALTEHHIQTLRRYCDRVVICYDGDRAGMNAAHKCVLLCEKLGMQASVALIPDGLDPDEYIGKHGGDKFRSAIIGNAVPSTKYKILYLKKEHTLQDDGSKLSYVRAALGIIAALSSPTEREHYAKELSQEVHYSFESLKQEMNEIRQKMRYQGDKNENQWNNDMNDKGTSAQAIPALRPAYQSAERQLLSAMMHSGDVAELVRERLGDGFYVEAHAALAAFLYAYYAEGKRPNPPAFISGLEDDRLMALAGSILLQFPQEAINEQVIEDSLKEIRKHGMELTLKQKQHALTLAEREGDFAKSAQIGIEIIALEKEMKQQAQRI
ncbi:DNA primase [Paenibacillus thermotolerans]|uniref:DNA primase n=1 Tax=Paenibacillus thermotolerans TaxID=3027807 RepID=UPI0023679E4A|nr:MULTISPECIES: DNA primase [unclassified Paenibacillus]